MIGCFVIVVYEGVILSEAKDLLSAPPVTTDRIARLTSTLARRRNEP